MRRFVAAVLVGGSVFITFSVANAAELCGRGFYRGLHGLCIVHHARWAHGLGFFEARPPCPYGYAWRFRACFPH